MLQHPFTLALWTALDVIMGLTLEGGCLACTGTYYILLVSTSHASAGKYWYVGTGRSFRDRTCAGKKNSNISRVICGVTSKY